MSKVTGQRGRGARGGGAGPSGNQPEDRSVELGMITDALNRTKNTLLRLNPDDRLPKDFAMKYQENGEVSKLTYTDISGRYHTAMNTRWFVKMHEDGPHVWLARPKVISCALLRVKKLCKN